MTDSSKNIKQENDALRTLNEDLKKELNDSRASLEQENAALRALNRNLKESSESEHQKSREIIGQAAAELNTVNQKILEYLVQGEQVSQALSESASELTNQESSADQTAIDTSEVNLLTEELQKNIANIDQLLTERQELMQSLGSETPSKLVVALTSLISSIFDDSLSSDELKERIDNQRKALTDEDLPPEVIEPLMALIDKLVERNEASKKLALQLTQERASQEVSGGQTAKLTASEKALLNEELQNAKVHINQLLTELQESKRNLESTTQADFERQQGLVEAITSLIANVFDDSLSSAAIKEQHDINRKSLEDKDLTPEAIGPLMALIENLMDRNEAFKNIVQELETEPSPANEALQATIAQLETNINAELDAAEDVNDLISYLLDDSLTNAEFKELIDVKREELRIKETSSKEVAQLLKLMDKLVERREEFVVTNEKLTGAERRSDYLFARLKDASAHLRRLRKKIRSFEHVSSQSEQEFIAAVQRSKNLERLLAKAEERYELIRTSSASQSDRLLEAIEQLRQISQSKDIEIQTLQSELTAITLKTDILFDSASIELNPEGKDALLKIAGILNNFSQGRVVSIEGHTDNQPLKHNFAQLIPSNWELSTRRAASAARFLIANGVLAENVRIVGHGELKPIASNDTAQGRAVNRRIEIHLVPQLKPQLVEVEASN